MKAGKVSQTVQHRSILKQIKYRRPESFIELSSEEMCGGISVNDEQQIVTTSAGVYGNEKDLCVYAMARVMNDLASRGAEPAGVGILIQLPPFAYESRLKAMVEYAERAGSIRGVQILYTKAEVNPLAVTSFVFVNGVGILEKNALLQSNMGKPDKDIVLIKTIGLEGAIRIVNEKKEQLSKRFVTTFLEPIMDKKEELFSVQAIDIARQKGALAIHQISEGGILTGLWEMAEAAGLGLEVRFKQIPLYQETIEICEYYQLNPYQLASAGSVLVVMEQGGLLVEALEELGTKAVVIGRTTNKRERVLINGEEKRYLDRPAPDELIRIFQVERFSKSEEK